MTGEGKHRTVVHLCRTDSPGTALCPGADAGPERITAERDTGRFVGPDGAHLDSAAVVELIFAADGVIVW